MSEKDCKTIQPEGAAAEAPPPWDFPMPGRDGVRAPIPRFPDLEGRHGYVMTEASAGVPYAHTMYDFLKWPEAMGQKKRGQPEISDLGTLVERNFEDNRDDCIAAGEPVFRDWSDLWGKHEGETLVVASTGPSLTRSLPDLYKHRDKFRLLTINRGLRAFTDPRFKPDYFHFVERRGLVDWVHEMDESGRPRARFDLSGIALLTTPQADPRVVRAFDPELRFWGYTSLGPLGHHNEVYGLNKIDVQATTTVGNVGLIAYKLGFKKLIWVGCDYAIESQVVRQQTEDGQEVHALAPARVYFDRPYGEWAGPTPPWAERPQPMMGHDGKCVLTTAGLIGCNQFFTAVSDVVQYSGGITVINATPRGIFRWQNMTLEEALACD